jgi:hypothetical protein
VEVVNHQVKQFSDDQHAKNSLAQCLTSTLKYVKSTELNKIVLANNQKNKIVQIQNVSTNSIINEFYKIVAPNMAAWLRDQYEKAKSTPYALDLSGLVVGECYVKINDRSYVIKNFQLDSASCSCYQNQSLGLPCRHIFFAKENQNLPLFNPNMVPDTHKINLLRLEVPERDINLVSSVPDLTSIRSLVTSKNMTQKSKWDAAWRISQEFANCLKYKKQKDFELSLAKLMQVKELLHSNTEFDIVPRIPNTNSVFNSIQSLPVHQNVENEKSIDCSQTSTVETPSKTFNYSVATKRIPEGSAPGRKVDKKSKINHSSGQLSLYSDGNTITNSNKSPIKNLLLVSTSTTTLKTVFEQRSFNILQTILLDKSKALDILNKKQLVEEECLIVNGELLNGKVNYEYNQFLKSTTNFTNMFTVDAYKQVEEIFKSYKISKTCYKCSIILNQKDSVKTCSKCYKLFHFSCTNLKTASTKKWACENC